MIFIKNNKMKHPIVLKKFISSQEIKNNKKNLEILISNKTNLLNIKNKYFL
jgi:hypothetical protein